MTAIEDLKAAKAAKAQGFAQKPQTQAASKQEPQPSHEQALALANGLGGVVGQQVSELGLLAQKTDEELTQLATPVANYFSSVADGTALVGKVLQIMNENSSPASLSAGFTVEAPVLPSVSTTTAADFFGKPQPIALPGK